jgi:predicted  nucleic acid-binding Zn-ribbon protein
VSSRNEMEQLQAEVDFYRDRVALLRAKLYRWGVGSNTRLQRLERELERAEQRRRDARLDPER